MDDKQVTITDPTDWLTTALPSFSQFDSSLRCQVCKDLFKSPMITSCSHTFCSICIRRCLSTDGKCPICREPEQTSKMRRNFAVEEVVRAFEGSRASALELAIKAVKLPADRDEDGSTSDLNDQGPSHPRRKRRKVSEEHDGDYEQGQDTGRRQTRSRSKRIPVSSQTYSQQSQSASSPEPEKRSARRRPPAEPQDGLCACPICGARMKEEYVFGHLSHCTGEAPKQAPPNDQRSHHFTPARQPTSRNTTTTSAQISNAPRERLPVIQFDLLKDNALRKKLQERGIPDSGSREMLKRRYTEWVNLWNAECDSDQPRSKRELLNELSVWEKTLGRQARERDASGNASTVAGGHLALHGNAGKEFDARKYVETHKNNFDDLIAQAKSRMKAAKDKEKQVEQGSDDNPANLEPGDEGLTKVKTTPTAADATGDADRDLRTKHTNDMASEGTRKVIDVPTSTKSRPKSRTDYQTHQATDTSTDAIANSNMIANTDECTVRTITSESLAQVAHGQLVREASNGSQGRPRPGHGLKSQSSLEGDMDHNRIRDSVHMQGPNTKLKPIQTPGPTTDRPTIHDSRLDAGREEQRHARRQPMFISSQEETVDVN